MLCARVALLPAAGGSRKLTQLQRVSVLPLGQAVPAQLTPQPSQNAQNRPPALFAGAQRHCCARTGLYRNLVLLKDFAQLLSLDWEQLGMKQGGRQPAALSSSTCSTKGPSSYLDAVSTGARVSASWCDTPGREGGKMKWNKLISAEGRCSTPDACPLGRHFSRHWHNSPEEQPWVLDAEVRGRVRSGERPDPVPISISRNFTTDLRRSRTGTHLCTSDPGGTDRLLVVDVQIFY